MENKSSYSLNKFANFASLLIVSICLIFVTFGIVSNNSSLPAKFSSEMLNINNSKVQQSFMDLGYVDRKIPECYQTEGLNSRYPSYGTSLENITEEEKDNLIKEASLLFPSENTFTSIDKDGNYLLNGTLTGKKLYRHEASKNMYEGNVKDDEKAVVRKISINATISRNYLTGLYLAPGEVAEITISSQDLEKIGSLTVAVGQVTHRNTINNIWKARNDFSRMPTIAGLFKITETKSYIGTPLGGPIFIYPEKLADFSCTISGAVTYPIYIHGYTTRSDFENMLNSSAPYFDFEIWDKGVRHSGPKSRANLDYDNLLKVGELWEKICRTSNMVPTNSSAECGVGYIYDPFVAAGEAVAFVGGRIGVNAPLYWMNGALSYDNMVTSGFWGQIHEFNHHFQNYGMSGSSTNEVTNNATSLLSYILYTNISSSRKEDDSSLSGWNRYLDPRRSLNETLSNRGNSQTGLNTYADIIHSFGVDNFIKATRNDPKKYTPSSWYQALSETLDYDFTYYFEDLLGLKIDEDIKTKYKDRKTFVPLASLYQTGRNYFSNSEEYFSDTVKPYLFKDKTDFILDFDNYLSYPEEFVCTIKNYTQPTNGRLVKISDTKFQYFPDDKKMLSGEFKIVFHLENADIKSDDITLTFNLGVTNGDFEKCYFNYDEKIYTNPDEALNNNFSGYSSKENITSKNTFINGISANRIGYVNGKILVPEDGEYTFCLRAGRGNHALYFSKDGKNYQKEIEFSGDKNTFDFNDSHIAKYILHKGDFLYFKQITISNNHNDAYTELGWSIDGTNMVTIPGSYLYEIDAEISSSSFTSDYVYPYTYSTDYTFYQTDSTKQKVLSSNLESWDDTTKIDNLTDGKDDTFYHSKQGVYLSSDNPFEIVLDLGETKIWNKIKFVGRKNGVNHLPTEVTLYVGNNKDSLNLIGIFKEDILVSGITSSINFSELEFRYLKIVVSDTNSPSNNKYICLSSIELSYTVSSIIHSNNLLNYYGDFTVTNKYLSSFGHLVSGRGTITYSGDFASFSLFTRNSNCQIKIKCDGNEELIDLNSGEDLKLAFHKTFKNNSTHNIEITILSGQIMIDSFMTC